MPGMYGWTGRKKALEELEGWGGEDMPADTRVVLAEEVPGIDMPRAVVTYAPGAEPYRPETEPRVVEIGDSPEEEALRAARNEDIDAFNARAREMAFRQMIGGITRTQPVDAVSPLGTAEKDMRSRLAQQRADALRELEMQNEAKRAAAYDSSVRFQQERELGRSKRAEDEGTLRRSKEQRLAEDRDAERLLRERALDLKERALNKPPKAPKSPPPAAAVDEVPFGDVVFRYEGDPNAMKEVRMAGAKAVREKAMQWNTTMAGLNQLEMALERFVKDPTPKNRALLYGPALSAAGATNAAIGQGAMSNDEKNAQFQALGVSMGDAAGLQALVERAFNNPEAAADMVARVRQMKELARTSVEAAAQPYSYRVKGSGVAAAPAAGGEVTLVGEDGTEYDVPASKADEMMKKHGLRRK